MVSVKVDYNASAMKHNGKLVLDLNHLLPNEFAKLYMATVRPLTPKKSSGLRRNISKQILGNKAIIFWRVRYAAAQNEGGHQVSSTRVIKAGPGKRDYITLKPGFYRYSNYTTPGTGPQFKEIAMARTRTQFMEEFYKAHPEYR